MKRYIMKLLVMMTLSSVITSCKSQNDPATQHSKNQRNQRPPSIEQIFETMDANEDGRLSETEVKEPLENNFAEIDTDSDGFLSVEEVENAPKPNRRTSRGRRQ
ncbi:EF-hand domain-containing protein [Aquimarina sp. U1-2]|uniref:EF-hand domain-containing protein n=1 Tax=Aquimarina sp. U1-2 TaxID=2823141 RepID=UPI001AECCC7A|nr:EF-hand domain-containing protein [Aquimarina sp. U1-2]MBP2830665.1 EF-hand domain-containing protein [Aquimarina sp. U1-2]